MGSRRRFTHISPREISAIGEGSETTREWGGNTLRYSPAPGKPVQLDKAYFEHDQSSFLKANRDNSKLARADWSHRITKMSAWCMTCSSAVSLRWLGDHSRRLQPNGGVEILWDHRCAALTRNTTQDLTVGTNLAINVRRHHPKSGESGVEAHGNATLSI